MSQVTDRPITSWPICATPDCRDLICKWAGTGLCFPCSVKNEGQEEMHRRLELTRADDGSWNGLVFVPLEAWVMGSKCTHCSELISRKHGWMIKDGENIFFVCPDGKMYLP